LGKSPYTGGLLLPKLGESTVHDESSKRYLCHEKRSGGHGGLRPCVRCCRRCPEEQAKMKTMHAIAWAATFWDGVYE
jgi:hypothetical protein